MTRLCQISLLRAKRDDYARRGRRGAVSIIEAQLRSLMMRQLSSENRSQKNDKSDD